MRIERCGTKARRIEIVRAVTKPKRRVEVLQRARIQVGKSTAKSPSTAAKRVIPAVDLTRVHRNG